MSEEFLAIDGFVVLDSLILEAFLDISRQFPQWDQRTDERLMILAKLRNFISCGKLALLFQESCLSNDEWWKSVESSVCAFDRHPNRPLEFDNFARFTMFQGLFSVSEAAVRSFAAALTGSTSLEKLYRVRATLLESLPSLPIEKKDMFSDLLRFAGTIRNCIHNNMVHTGENVVLEFRGTQFAFQAGKPPGFLSWYLFIHLAHDLAEMFHELALTSEISTLVRVKSFVDFALYASSTDASCDMP